MAQKTLVIRPSDIPAFRDAIAHNYKVVAEQIRTHRFCDQDYYFVRLINGVFSLVPPGSHDADLVRASNDYIAGALVGALPYSDLHGSDGIKIDECGNIREVELKLCMKSGDRYEINTKGHIQVVDGAGSFRSDCAAHFEIVFNLSKKCVDTYLVCFDKSAWRLIDIYKMAGEKIVELLGKNQNSGEDKTSKKRSISLSAFMKYGQKVYQDVTEEVGVEAWEHDIYRRCGRHPSEGEPFWNDEKKAKLRELYESGLAIGKIRVILGASTDSAVKSQVKKNKIRRPAKS